ncbi:hypothetical protein ACCO45_011120 [Purpureocillium lilacinum]|uniref:Uncharacterized protein n=1 Tax=Purpureocillium lilacinum TaxID=33203 RepID=A0ACC4DHE2_PURLI
MRRSKAVPPGPLSPSLSLVCGQVPQPEGKIRAGGAPTAAVARGRRPVLDIKTLRDPNLVPDQYVSKVLGDATEEQIQEFEETLRKLKARAATDLQQNLMQNRTQFIKISKEAEKLKALYKNVEGSQKFLPNAAGRHVVQNAGPWIELDNATYKSRRAMQIFLLNDHLLIASRKKRKVDAPNTDTSRGPMIKLVADRCWPLLDVEVVDMPGTGESSGGRNKLADAIMVRGGGQESFIYRTEKPEDSEKKSLLLNVRKAVEELRKGLQSEMEANNKARETINYFASRDPGLLQKTELLETLSDIKDMLIEVDGKQQNLRWVESQMDELDIDVSLQRIEPAVARVEKLKGLARGLKSNVVAQDFIDFKVEERCSKLAGILIHEVEMTHNNQSKTKRNVSWLARLGFEDRAREAYLAARSDTIHKRARQCIFQGDLHLYIWQLSFVYFTIIHNTVQCFQGCFPPPMMSACVKWAKEQVWTQCMERAKEHAQKLSDVGLDFKDLVGRGLEEEAAAHASAGAATATPVGLGLA